MAVVLLLVAINWMVAWGNAPHKGATEIITERCYAVKYSKNDKKCDSTATPFIVISTVNNYRKGSDETDPLDLPFSTIPVENLNNNVRGEKEFEANTFGVNFILKWIKELLGIE